MRCFINQRVATNSDVTVYHMEQKMDGTMKVGLDTEESVCAKNINMNHPEFVFVSRHFCPANFFKWPHPT